MEEYERLHCMVPTMIFIPHCEFVYFYTIHKGSHNKEKQRASLSLHRIHPLYAPFTYAHKLSPGPLKVRPQHIHACFIFLSRYIQWRSLYLKGKHDTYIDFTIQSLRSPFTFCGYYIVMGSPYNSVFAQDTTS